MNEKVNKFLLAGDKFLPEIHLRKPGFTYIACGTFNKNKERIKKFKEAGDSRCIYQNELYKACFQHDMAYGALTCLRFTAKYCIIKHLILLKIQNMKDINEVLLPWFMNFLIKKFCYACK